MKDELPKDSLASSTAVLIRDHCIAIVALSAAMEGGGYDVPEVAGLGYRVETHRNDVLDIMRSVLNEHQAAVFSEAKNLLLDDDLFAEVEILDDIIAAAKSPRTRAVKREPGAVRERTKRSLH